MGRVAQAAFAGAAALAVGAGMTVPAYAACDCQPPYGQYCGQFGYSCPSAGGCPSGCRNCYPSDDSHCIYPNTAYWTVNCGSCFIYCFDCVCGSNVCGCKSACITTRPPR